jgi:hypothetical protein
MPLEGNLKALDQQEDDDHDRDDEADNGASKHGAMLTAAVPHPPAIVPRHGHRNLAAS